MQSNPLPCPDMASPHQGAVGSSLEAHRRAPTLMAGVAAGSQGAVRVWSPDLRRLKWTAVGSTSVIVLAVLLMFSPVHVWIYVGLGIPGLIGAVRALRRPCYITTDDAGIGVTTPSSSQSMRWSEIERLNRFGDQWYLETKESIIPLRLTGYTPRAQVELQFRILTSACLLPHPTEPSSFVSSAALPATYRARLGSGMSLDRSGEGSLTVTIVEPTSPAADSGLSLGDQIVQIGNRPAHEIDIKEANRILGSPAGTTLNLQVCRRYEFPVKASRLVIRAPFADAGAVFTMDEDGRLIVSSVQTHSPAEAAGVCAGDELVEIDGLPADSISEEQANAEMAGPAGAVVDLLMQRPAEEFWFTTRLVTRMPKRWEGDMLLEHAINAPPGRSARGAGGKHR